MEDQSLKPQIMIPQFDYAAFASQVGGMICDVATPFLAAAILGFWIHAAFKKKTAKRIQRAIDIMDAMGSNKGDDK